MKQVDFSVHCVLCRSKRTCLLAVFFCVYFLPRKARSPVSMVMDTDLLACVCSISVTLVQLAGVGLSTFPGQTLLAIASREIQIKDSFF